MSLMPRRDDRALVLFVFAADRSLGVGVEDLPRQKELLHELFGKDGWECPQILAALDDCQELYFDRVSQIRMNGWSKGRVALVGDAAFCVSLIGGQGSALAMTGAYILAGEIARAEGRPEIAFSRYEERLRAYIEGKQKGAERFARSFVPGSRLGLFVRNQVTKFLTIPMVARLAFGRVLAEQLTLPDYSDL
jgi:2-polyprenyl-6-methoxyphenol hydroxylase-like FAD-dependent oxidoreductase